AARTGASRELGGWSDDGALQRGLGAAQRGAPLPHLQLPVAAPAGGRPGLGGVAVPLAAEPDARLDHVVGLGATEDLTGHVGQEGVHAMALGTDLDPAGQGVGDHLTRAVTVAHRCPLSRWTTDPWG